MPLRIGCARCHRVQGLTFEGVSGKVALDASADRAGNFEILNLRLDYDSQGRATGRQLSSFLPLPTGGAVWERVAIYEVASSELRIVAPPVFPGRQARAPADASSAPAMSEGMPFSFAIWVIGVSALLGCLGAIALAKFKRLCLQRNWRLCMDLCSRSGTGEACAEADVQIEVKPSMQPTDHSGQAGRPPLSALPTDNELSVDGVAHDESAIAANRMDAAGHARGAECVAATTADEARMRAQEDESNAPSASRALMAPSPEVTIHASSEASAVVTRQSSVESDAAACAEPRQLSSMCAEVDSTRSTVRSAAPKVGKTSLAPKAASVEQRPERPAERRLRERRPSHSDSQLDSLLSASDVAFDLQAPPLGFGGMGSVHYGTWHGSPVAIKVLLQRRNHKEASLRQALLAEALVLSKLRHPCICSFFGVLGAAWIQSWAPSSLCHHEPITPTRACTHPRGHTRALT